MKSWRNYKVDPVALRVLLCSFYALILVIDYSSFLNLAKQENFYGAFWLWPLTWVSALPSAHLQTFLTLLLLFTMLIHALCFFFPFNRGIKFTGFFLFFILIAAKSSFGKIDHNLHGFLFASFCLSFIAPQRAENFLRQAVENKFFIWATQVAVLGTYSLSGIWKLRTYLNYIIHHGWSGLDPLANALDSNLIQGFLTAPQNGFMLPPVLSNILWIGVILFETFSPWVAWNPKYQRAFGVFLIFMHAGIGYLTGIYFFTSRHPGGDSVLQ